ncbi:MAG: DUF3127 domain-containing protein [Pirellulaceae bacterium]|jgi:hypothetical protein|nr:DUF3127 domain-containing protein [Pirellulaceae bacterium]
MSESVVSGVVHVIEETKTFGAKGFRKRLVVLEQDNGRFANYIPIEFIQDGCDSVDQLNVGDEIEVTFRLSGRKWQKDPGSEVKFFLSAEGLRFNKTGGGKKSPPAADPNRAFQEANQEGVDDADVPF